MMNISLESIDIVRERAAVSYKEAKEALEQTNGDVVDAIILLETQSREKQPSPQWLEQIQTNGNELVDRIKELVKEGNVRRIRILKDDQVVLEFPVTAGAVGALLLPKLAALGALAAFLARCTIEVEKIQQTNTEAPPTDEEVLDEQ